MQLVILIGESETDGFVLLTFDNLFHQLGVEELDLRKGKVGFAVAGLFVGVHAAQVDFADAADDAFHVAFDAFPAKQMTFATLDQVGESDFVREATLAVEQRLVVVGNGFEAAAAACGGSERR